MQALTICVPAQACGSQSSELHEYRDAAQQHRALLLDAAAANAAEPDAFVALRAHEAVVVVRSTAHYVVVHIYRDRVYGVRARLYDGLNSRGVLSSRTQAGFLAVQHVRRTFALANREVQIGIFDDGVCAVQSDTSTCGLHAAYNAALLAQHRLPSEPPCCAMDAAVDVMVDLAHAALLHRRGACRCPTCLPVRVARGYGRLVEALARRLARPRQLRGALSDRCARNSEVWEDGEVLPLELPVPTPRSDLKKFLHRAVYEWGCARRDRVPRPEPDAPAATGAAAGAAPVSGLGAMCGLQPGGDAMELDHARGADEHGVGTGDGCHRVDGDGGDTSSEDGSGCEGTEDEAGDEPCEDAARYMSRSLLRSRYFQLLEAATAASVAADCTLAALKLEATEARARADDAARLAATHDGYGESSPDAGAAVSAVGVVVRRLGSAALVPAGGC